MAKTFVVNLAEGSRIPFLRGIMTRSLQNAGMEFDAAFELASRVRDELSGVAEISTDELRDQVLARLKELKPRAAHALVVDSYENCPASPPEVMVQTRSGGESPFSRRRHQRNLEASGLAPDQAAVVTTSVFESLLVDQVEALDTHELIRLTTRTLKEQHGQKAAKRYVIWNTFLETGRPLLLLIGGTNGCGKSTIATEVALRMDIVRIQSTDMLREVMRQMMPPNLLPVLHQSSFKAWQALPYVQDGQDPERLLEDGFRSQSELLNVPCEAVLTRARRERVSMVLEGIHILPAWQEPLSQQDGDAIVVSVMLSVLKPRELKKRLRGRSSEAPERRARRYLDHFDSIWQLQSLLLSDADTYGVPIVDNDSKSRVIQEVMLTVNRALGRALKGEVSAALAEYG